MMDPDHKKLSKSRQCEMLDISRSSTYYKSLRNKALDLKLMRLIDERYLKTPCWGSRSMRNYLRRLGYKVNRKRLQRLTRQMGLEAIYPEPKPSRPHPEHKAPGRTDLALDRTAMPRRFLPGLGHARQQPAHQEDRRG